MEESALDVLSRAASMVEKSDANTNTISMVTDDLIGHPVDDTGDTALKRSMDEHDSPPKDLPTKFQKHQRMRERQGLSQTLGFDEEHADKCNSKKCAGTQTPFSSFAGEPYSGQNHGDQFNKKSSGDDRYILNLGGSQPSPPSTRVSPPLPMPHMYMVHPTAVMPYGSSSSSSSSSSTSSPSSRSVTTETDNNNTPLNLTVSSSTHQHHQVGGGGQGHELADPAQCMLGRPSVITHANTATTMPTNCPFVESANGVSSVATNSCSPALPSMMESRTSRRQVNAVEMCDPVIEEHFRRSLGRNYPDYLSRNKPAPSPPAPAVVQAAVQPLPQTPALTQPPVLPPMYNHTQIQAVPTAAAYTSASSFSTAPVSLSSLSVPSASKPASPPVLAAPSSPCPAKPAATNQTNVSVTGTVDEHFAKSLGDTWTRLKAEKEAMDVDLLAGTVDDHFAKALGCDTWFKIKAQTETGSAPASPMSTSPGCGSSSTLATPAIHS